MGCLMHSGMMRGRRVAALFVSLAFLSLSSSALAQTIDKAKLDQFFDRIAEKNKGMGSVVVARDGQVLYTRAIGFGRINGAEKQRLSAASRFRVGSISKMFTGVLALQLVEQGKLKLTDTLDAHFPNVPNAKKITVAHMLGHTSGVFNVTDERDYRDLKLAPKTRDEMAALIAKGKPEFEPGAKYSYSNSNFVLLGYIVETAAGKPLKDLLQERIVDPLGLKDTYLADGFSDAAKNEVSSFRYIRDWERMDETHMSVPGGAGAVVSTPADLAKFIHALFEMKLVSKPSLDRMKNDKFAMITYPIGGETFFGHGGSIDGFRSTLVYLSKEKLAVAYTANGSVFPSQELVGGVIAISRNQPYAIPTFEGFAVSTETLDKYVGVYSSSKAPLKFKITREGEKLFAGPEGRQAAPLSATAEGKFKIEGSAITIEFDAAKKQMTMRRPGRETVFTKEG